MRKSLTIAAGAALSAAGLILGAVIPSQAQAAEPLPVSYNFLTGFLPNLPNASVAPAGAIAPDSTGKVASCSSPGKNPVLLVHGTWENMNSNWQAASPLLKNAGFCVYAFNYGGNPGDAFYGTKAITSSAVELGVMVDKVRAATGAAKIDLLGHSQGGMMPRQYIKFGSSWTGGKFGVGQPKIDKLVALAPSNGGTTLSNLANLGAFLGLNPTLAMIQPGPLDQALGSDFLKKLATCPNGLPAADICAGDKTKYTILETNGDQVVTPYTQAFLKANPAASGSLTNTLVQDKCFQDFSEHLSITYDSFAYGLVLKALGVADPASVPGASPTCKFIAPYVGG